jgi:hypothetical protein
MHLMEGGSMTRRYLMVARSLRPKFNSGRRKN